MSILITLIAAIIIFSILVLVHEWGHFITAKRNGIKVLEFGIGFPPRVKKLFKRDGTLYTINAIPFGGFVRMYGEDSSDPKMLKSRGSFSSKSAWQRTKVIVAGVFMNFLLAIFLLTVGFSFGIEPLIMSSDDLFSHVRQGNVILEEGVFVGAIKENSQAEKLGLNKGDKIIAINDVAAKHYEDLTPVIDESLREQDLDLRVLSTSGVTFDVHFIAETSGEKWGLDLKTVTPLPRLTLLNVERGSLFEKSGFLSGDQIIKVNGQEILVEEDWRNMLATLEPLHVDVLRDRNMISLDLNAPSSQVILSEVYVNTPAQKAGIRPGDILNRVNGELVSSPLQVQELISKSQGETVLQVIRAGKYYNLKATPNEGLIGVAITKVDLFKEYLPTWYEGLILTSLKEIKKVRFPIHKAFTNSLYETKRLTWITLTTFGRTVKNLATNGEVPSEVGGPVRIAAYTHIFVKEGFFALLRFTALLSVSLGVINILPIPALDGGRLLFILVEVVTKKRPSPRFEALVHNLGFAILIFLVLLITYNDILQIF